MKRKRTLREFTAIHGIKTMLSDGTLYNTPGSKGIKSYDALAYDKVSSSPTLNVPVGYNKPAMPATVVARYIVPLAQAMTRPVVPTPASKHVHNTDGLINTKPVDLHDKVKVTRSQVYDGWAYRDDSTRAKRAYLESHSLDNILLPTAANDLCFRCGLTVSCKCDKHANDMPYLQFVEWLRSSNPAWQAANLIEGWCG